EIQIFIKKLKKLDSNPQILSIIDYFTIEDCHYLIEEYISGKTIKQLIAEDAIFSGDTILKLIENTAVALSFYHQEEIIHGNIKPSSLIQSQDQEKIILRNFNIVGDITNDFSDYGIAQKDAVTDIYHLGMTAIYALTGINPQKLEKNPHTGQILWETKAHVSSGIVALINKMICSDQDQAYQSTEQVIRKIKKVKSRAKIPLWYLYSIFVSLGLIGILFMVAQWGQRAAILEFYKADIMLEEQQYWSAIDYYDAGLKKIFKTKKQVKNYQQVWLKKATAFNRLGEYQKALNTCNKALKYYQSYQLWNCRGLALDSLVRYDEAVLAYDKAIALEPEYLWLWNNRGEVYTKLGVVDQAIADFEKAISLNKQQSFVPWNNLGKLYYQQQQYQEAMIPYQNAIAIKQDYVPALIGLGNCYKSLKDYALALETYEQVIKIDDHAYEAWLGKGLAEESLQKYAAAAKTYQQALSIKEDQENGEVVEQALQRVLDELKIEN
ncbi:MAG: tetratricopeptide repeat protein, partial [Cyanobacteria bacterium P01_F01_bin.143]